MANHPGALPRPAPPAGCRRRSFKSRWSRLPSSGHQPWRACATKGDVWSPWSVRQHPVPTRDINLTRRSSRTKIHIPQMAPAQCARLRPLRGPHAGTVARSPGRNEHGGTLECDQGEAPLRRGYCEGTSAKAESGTGLTRGSLVTNANISSIVSHTRRSSTASLTKGFRPATNSLE